MINISKIYNYSFNNNFSISKHFHDNKSGIDIYIGYDEENPEYQIINIWGSSDRNDWLTNFNFLFKPYRQPSYIDPRSKIRVHRGYLTGWETMRKEVLSYISNKKVIVTGYSMGGGLSSLVAIDVKYNLNPIKLICVDFEGAKIWNKAGIESVNKRIPNLIKITYGNDVVPKIPPFYYYAGKEYHIGKKKHWYIWSIKDHIDFQSDSTIIPLLEKLDIKL